MTIEEIAERLRELYPDAVSVQVFVNVEGHHVETDHKPNTGPDIGATYRCLDGQWAHDRTQTR